MKAAPLDRKWRPSGAASRQEGRKEGVLSRGHYQEGTEEEESWESTEGPWTGEQEKGVKSHTF